MDMIGYEENSKEIIYEQIKTSERIPIKVVEIKIDESQDKNHVPMHWHRSIEIIVPKINSTKVWIEGKIYKVDVNHFLIVNSKEIHDCKCSVNKEEYLGYAIQIKYDFLKNNFNDIDSYYFDTFCTTGEAEILDILNTIIDVFFADDSLKSIRIMGLVCELLYLLLKDHCHIKKGDYLIQSMKQKDRLVEILNYIDENCDDIGNVQQIADYFHLSYGYIAKLFKTYLNMTLHDYLSQSRIKRIENDLITTDKSITDICLSHGFSNTQSFYREFSKYNGMTPKEYRNSSRK